MVVQPEWITPGKLAVLRVTEMEALLARLDPGYPRLPADTQWPERVSVPQASLVALYLVHPLMFSPFLDPATVWHMMHI